MYFVAFFQNVDFFLESNSIVVLNVQDLPHYKLGEILDIVEL